MPTKTKGLAVIQWPVKDLEKSLVWYQSILGVSLTFPYNPGDTAAWLNLGNAGFGLVQTREVPVLNYKGMGGEWRPLVQFRVDDIHEVHRTLRSQGIEVSEINHGKGGDNFTIVDPDGNQINLWGGWPQAPGSH
jgi:predicted enzyme related to lactoylglutathione lyase